MIDNIYDWRLKKTQYNNLKNNKKLFDHYIYYENSDEKVAQKDCFSNRFV